MWLAWWFLFVLVLAALPTGYGRYRGWGTPYPYYYRRRRSADVEYRDSWGVIADVVWVALFVAVLWLALAIVV